MTLLAKINETAAFLKGKGMEAPEFGLILGSGLGELAEEIENPVVVDYSEIPNWGRSTVVGHAGKLVNRDLAGRKVYQDRQQEKNDDLGERGKMHSASVKGSHYHRQEQSARDSRKGERERPQV